MNVARLVALLSSCGVVLAASCVGCEPPPEPLPIPAGCHPLVYDVDCGVPYPSDFFLVDDATLPSGKRVVIPAAAALVTEAGLSGDVHTVRAADGFSRVTPIVFTFGAGVDAASVPGLFDDPAQSEGGTGPTVLLNAATGAFVPHFVDVDPRSEDDARQAIVLRPLQRLDAETRYIVAVRDVRGSDGSTLAPPEAFRRLRDGNVGDDPVLKPQLQHYDDAIFPALADAGVDPGGLQLAWDFTTGSVEHVVTDLLRARELTLAALAADPPAVAIDAVLESGAVPSGGWRLVLGTVTGPRVTVSDEPGSALFRDDSGAVALNGTRTFPFTAIISDSVRDGFDPGGVLLFGHGFFGERDEATGNDVVEFARSSGRTVVAIDWEGMSSSDLGIVVSNIGGDVARTLDFGERVPQGLMNWLSLTAALQGPLQAEPAFIRPAEGPGVVVDPQGGASNAGAVVYDPSDIAFLGISMGHILGGTLAALNPALDRVVLNVGGAAFSQLMFRANPFGGFLGVLNFSLPDRLDQQKFAAAIQSQFDRFDPATYASYVLQEELPIGPPGGFAARRVLLQIGVGDSQVPNIGSELHARYLGIPLVTPSPWPMPLVDEQPAPFAGSGIFFYDFGVDNAFNALAIPPSDENPVHNAVRASPEAREQLRRFVNEGVIVNPCEGPCVLPL